MVWLAIVALLLTALSLPSLAARALGGQPPYPWPPLAALAPAAVLPAVAAVIVAAAAAWWLALLLAIPAAVLVSWQLPARPPRARAGRARPGDPAGGRTVRVLTVNVLGGHGDPAAVAGFVQAHAVDILAVQELTEKMAHGLAEAGIGDLLPCSRTEPRPGSAGSGLWSRWPLTPLPDIPGLVAAAPRGLAEIGGGLRLMVNVVHTVAPVKSQVQDWQRELGALRAVLAACDGPLVVAGDFNATRDHRPFRELLAAGLADSMDVAQSRPWPGLTWPVTRWLPRLMRLDHVLVSRHSAAVRAARTVRVPGTDHLGVLAVIDFTVPSG